MDNALHFIAHGVIEQQDAKLLVVGAHLLWDVDSSLSAPEPNQLNQIRAASWGGEKCVSQDSY